MNCPSCTTPMIEETHHGVTVDRCQSCQGFWFDIEEIQRYLNARGTLPGQPVPKDPDFVQAETGPARECPCCDENALHEGRLRGIAFSRCSWCGGIFLSGDDLNKIQRDISDGKMAPIPGSGRSYGERFTGLDFAEIAFGLIFGLFGGFD